MNQSAALLLREIKDLTGNTDAPVCVDAGCCEIFLRYDRAKYKNLPKLQGRMIAAVKALCKEDLLELNDDEGTVRLTLNGLDYAKLQIRKATKRINKGLWFLIGAAAGAAASALVNHLIPRAIP